MVVRDRVGGKLLVLNFGFSGIFCVTCIVGLYRVDCIYTSNPYN